MSELLSFGVLVLLTIGLTEVAKRALKLNERFVPLAALVLGFILCLVGNLTNITPLTILMGIAVGLSASGLFDNGKAILTKKRQLVN